MTKFLPRASGALRHVLASFDVRDVLFFSGVGSICRGIWEIYPPGAWVFAGVAAIFLAFFPGAK